MYVCGWQRRVGTTSPENRIDLKRTSLATRTLQANQETRLDGEPVFVCQNQNGILQTTAAKVKPFIYKDLAMSLQTLPVPRFVRRTGLGWNEYRKNFRQVDCDVIAAVTSREADRVTPLMSKIYLRLANAPGQYWEREGVLRFEAEPREEGQVKAWDALCELLGVASATASKALRWMHEQGIVGYFAGKNGAGIRVFINRASSSIGTRAAGEKILEFRRASSQKARASSDEAAFSDSFADSESLETDVNPRAPKNGADSTGVVKSYSTPPRPDMVSIRPAVTERAGAPSAEELTELLLGRLEPAVRAATAQAAAREHERTREWLETKGLPKAARVAQREAYNVLRKYGAGGEAGRITHADVGRDTHTPGTPRPLADDEITELAQACVAMLEAQGRPVEVTLSEMGVEEGGFLPPEDAQRVRQKVDSLMGQSSARPTP